METVQENLVARHVDLDLHRPVVDEDARVATFHLWNLSGQMVGYQHYRPDAGKTKNNDPKESRYYTYQTKNRLAMFGVESLVYPGPVFLTEGLFDAARMTKHRRPGLAALSNSPTKQVMEWLWCLNRPIVVVRDDDKAGKALAKFGDYVEVAQEHDLNAAPEAYVQYLLEKYPCR